MLEHITRRFRWWRSILWLFVVFEAVFGSGDELRIHQEACTHHRLATNKNSFNYRKLGNGSSLEDCIDYCCRDDTCELAMLSHFHCFGVSCNTPELCHEILDRLLMEDEKQLKRNPRNTGTDFIKHTSQVANPRCPQRFVPSFHVLLLQSGSHIFRVLRKQPMSASQCRADCCGSRECLLSFIEEGSCYGVFGRNATNAKQEAGIGLHVAIIDRNKERSRSLDDDDEDDADDDPDDFGSDYSDKKLSSKNYVHGTLNLRQNATKEERYKMYTNKQTAVGKEVKKAKASHSPNLQTGHVAKHSSVGFETNKNDSDKQRGHITKQTLAGQGTFKTRFAPVKTKKTHSPNLQTGHVSKQYSEGFEGFKAKKTEKTHTPHLQKGRYVKQSSVRFRVSKTENSHASNLQNGRVVKKPSEGFEVNKTRNSLSTHPQYGRMAKQTSEGQGVNKSENTLKMQSGHVVKPSSVRKGVNRSGNSHSSEVHYKHITKQTPVKQGVNRSEKNGTPNLQTGYIVKKSSVRLRVNKTESSHIADVRSGHMAKQTLEGQGEKSNMRDLQYEHFTKGTAQDPGVNKVQKNQMIRHPLTTSGVSTTVYRSDKVYNYNVKTIQRPTIRKESTLGFHVHHPTTPTTTIHLNPSSTTKLAEHYLTKSWQSKTLTKHPDSARKTQNLSKTPIPADKMSSVNHPRDSHKNVDRQLNAVLNNSSRKSLKQSYSLKLFSSSKMQNASKDRSPTLKEGMDNEARHSNYSSRISRKSKLSLEDRTLKPTMKIREKTIKLVSANDVKLPSPKNKLGALRKTPSKNKSTEVLNTEHVQAVKQKAKSSWVKQKVISVKRWMIPHVVAERRGKVPQSATRRESAKNKESPIALTASSKSLHPEGANYSVFDVRTKQKKGHERTNPRQKSDLAKELNDLGSDDEEEDKNSDQNIAKLKKLLPLLDEKNSNTKTQDKHSTMTSKQRAPKIKTMQGLKQAQKEKRNMQKLESPSKAHTSLQHLNVNHRTVLQRKSVGLDNHGTLGKEFVPHKDPVIEKTSHVIGQDTDRKAVRKTEKATGVQPKVDEDRQKKPSPRPVAYAKFKNTKLGHFQTQLAKFNKTAGFKESHIEYKTLRNGTQSNDTLKDSKRLDANRSGDKTSPLKAKGKLLLYQGRATGNTGRRKVLSQEKMVKNTIMSPPLGNKKKQIAKWSKSEKHRKNNTVLGEDLGEGMSASSKTEIFHKNPSVFGEDDDGSKTISPLHRQVDEGSDLMQFAYLENSGEMSMTIQQSRNHSAHSDVHRFKTTKTAKSTIKRNDTKRHDTAKSRKASGGQVRLKNDNESHISDETFSRFNHWKGDRKPGNRSDRTHSINFAVVGTKPKLHHSVLTSRHPTVRTNTRYSSEKDSTVHGRLLVSPQKTTPSQIKFVNLRGAFLPERELIPSYTSSFPEAEKVKEQKLNGKTVAKETKLSNDKHNSRSATTDSILAHFLNDGSASDGVEFSVRSGKKHSKGGNKHDSRMQQDDSLDLEDLGDADFDIMMSNDIPHKDPKNADKKSKGKRTKEKDSEENTTSKEKDIVVEDDDDDNKSLKTKNSGHSQRINKKKASKSKKDAKTPRTSHKKKQKEDDNNTKEKNLKATHKHKKHHKDGGDKDKRKESDKTSYDNDKKTHRAGKHRQHYNDNKWVGKIIPGKIKVTHNQGDKGVKKHREEGKDNDEKEESHAEHKEDRTRHRDDHHPKRERKKLHHSDNSDDNDADEQHKDARKKKQKRKHGDQEEVNFEKLGGHKQHEDDHKRAQVKQKHKSHNSKNREFDKQQTGETRDEEPNEHHKHYDATAKEDQVKTERETKKSRKHHHLVDHERSGKKRFKGEKQMREKHRKQNDETGDEQTVATNENKKLKSRKHHPRNHGEEAEKRTDVNYQVVKTGRHGVHYHEEFSDSGDEVQNSDNDEEDGSNGSEPSDYDNDDDNDDGSNDTSSDDGVDDKDEKNQGRDSKEERQGSRIVLGEDSDDETEDADGYSRKRHRKHRKMEEDRNDGEKNESDSYHSDHQRSHHENHRKSDFRHTLDQRRSRKLRRKHHKSHLRTLTDEEGSEDEDNHVENNRRNFRESLSDKKRYEVQWMPARHRGRERDKKEHVQDSDSFDEDDRHRENDRQDDHHRASGSYRHHGHHGYSPNEDSERYYDSERSHEGRRTNNNRFKDESRSRDHASHKKYYDENDVDNEESEPGRDYYIHQHGKKHLYQKTQGHLDYQVVNRDRSGFRYRDELQREHGIDQEPLHEEQESFDGGNLRHHKAERERHYHLKDEGGRYEDSFIQDENSQDRGDTRNNEDSDREKDYEKKHEKWARHKEKGHKKNRYHFHRKEEHRFGEPDGSFDSSAWMFNEGTEDDSFHGGESNHGKHRRRHRKHRQSYEYWRYGQQYPYYNYGTQKQPYSYNSRWPPFGGWQKQQYQEYHQWKPSPSSRWYPNNNDNDYRWDIKSPWRSHSRWSTTPNPKQETWQKYLDGGQNEETPTPSNKLAPNDWGPTQSTWQKNRATQKGFLSSDWPHNQNLEGDRRHYKDWSSFKSPTPGNNWARPQYMPQHNSAPSAQPWQSYDNIPSNTQNSPAPQGVQSKYVPFAHQQNGSEFGSQASLRPTGHRPFLTTVAPQIWTRENLTKVTNIITTLNQPLLAPSGKQSNVIPSAGQMKPPGTTRNNMGQVSSNQNASRDQDIQRLNGFFNEESGGQKKSGIEKPQTKTNSSSQNVSSSVNGSQRNQLLPAKSTTPLTHLQQPHPANITTKKTLQPITTATTPSKTSINHTTKPADASQENTTTVPRTTTEHPPTTQPFGDAPQPDESSEEKGNKHRKHRAPICMAGKITDDLTLLRGKRAGNFTSIGDVGDFEMCIKRCCQHKKCNLAFKSAETCFLVHCFSKESCQTSPSVDDIFSPRMCFVKRSLRDGEDPDEGDGGDDKVSPAGIHEVCEEERAFGILWQKTVAGRSSKHPCPREAKGFVKRRCEADSRWLPPDFSDCVSSDYQDLYEKSKRLAVGDDPSPLILELSMLTTHNIDNSLIFGGDLDRATDIMASIVQHNGQTDLPMTGEDVENFVKASSNLLDMTNQQEWTHLQMEKPGSADVLRSMEMFALQAARRLPREDMTEPTITNNIIIKMDRKSAGDEGLTFPDYSNPKINRWDARHDIIDLPASVFDRGEVSTASISFKSLPYLLPDSNISTGLGPNSKVISTVLYPHSPEKITPPVTIALSHIKRRRGNPKCVFWDYTLNPHKGGAWSSQGCWLAFSNQSHSICQCNHLSNFAVLMDLSSDEVSQKEQKKERTMALMWIGIPVLIVGVIGALYMSFSWNRKSGIPSTVTRPSTSLNEKTGLLGQRVVTSQVREEFPSSPSRDLYRALSPGYSPTSADLEWQDEFDLDMESSDHGFKKILLPRLQLLQKQLINEFYEGDKTEAKKQFLESKIQPPLQPKPKRTSRTWTAQPVLRPTMRPASRKLRVRFADESLLRRNLTDDDKERLRRLQRMERRVFIQHLRRWRASSHLNLSD